MSKVIMPDEKGNQLEKALSTTMKRSSFLKYTGVGMAASALILAGCKDNDDDNPTATTSVDLGSGDVGVLNYAYALEQLEAAFYAQVVATPYANISADEKAYFTSIAKHEAIHRDFFKAALTGAAPDKIIPGLTPDFSKVNFTDRTSVLTTAKTFEDLGVAAYNGAGVLLKNADYLLLAGKIVSVEARHAAVVRDLISNGSFADDSIVDATTGLDKAMSVADVLTAAQSFIKEKITGANVGK